MDMMARRRVIMQAAIAQPTIDKYVHDSMVLWLDGISNTRRGHDANALKWEDLSGNGRDYAYNAANIINDDHFLANGYAINTDNGLPIDGTIKTIEIVLGFIASTSGQLFIPLGNRFGTTAFGTYSGKPYVLFEATDNNVFSAHVYGRSTDSAPHSYNSDGYVDGGNVPVLAARASWSDAAPNRLFGYYRDTLNVPRCKIYALRLYSRHLTSNEVAHNARLDAERFNTGG